MLRRVIFSPISAGSKRLGFVVDVGNFFVVVFVDLAEVVFEAVISVEVVVDGISELVVVTAVVADEDMVELLDSVLEFMVGADSELGLTKQNTTIATVINAATIVSITFFIIVPFVKPTACKPACMLNCAPQETCHRFYVSYALALLQSKSRYPTQ